MSSKSNPGAASIELHTPEVFKKTYLRLHAEGLTLRQIAKQMGYVGHQSVHKRAQRFGLPTSKFDIEIPPDDVTPVDLILERKGEIFKRKQRAEEAAELIQVRVNVEGPIGILHFGDPHIDDDGCDIVTLRRHIQLVKENEALFGANVGDTTNNWVGRLAHLYSEQTTTAAEALRLLEWFVREVDWLYLLGGNHDLWSGARDPIDWIQRQRGAIYTPSECRLQLNFPKSTTKVRINARHDFRGHSMWNPAHGVTRAMQMGDWDDIAICGHRHVSGYLPLVAPDKRVCHAIQVSSYKQFDRYAKTKGFRNQSIEPGCVTIINPDAKNPAELITVFVSVETGVDYLKYLRS